MGTDREEVYRDRCLCGGGEVVIVFCSPDHPWPTKSKWFETAISCANCGSTFDLIEQNNSFSFVEKSEVAKREALWKEHQHRSDNLLKLPETMEVLEEFKKLLETQPSVAARYRILAKHRLVHGTYGTFRKRWIDAEDWIKTHVRARSLTGVLEILGKSRPKIATEVEELKGLYERYSAPLPTVGKPLLDTSPYRK
jgi:hypothetical protein